ncbi:protein-disulfide reductase DsbD [Roseomonas sp. CECT 9278]|uniref:protein-disulfide reductase DsbD family protein n=1 Tax=Roseomonas sp. CECT 9278 TaxID=2845823 RepID=UPI001E4BB373|nr:thioredoxin family protein [Roseomonas sp. CECT 9278]CAH0273988.1 Thiol:disulfide interchange protein DsbD [Roseomonas sp. CECT 9278]
MSRLLAVLFALTALAPAARALESLPVASPRATVTIVSDHAQVTPGQSFRLALRQRLAPGWHTYWTNPGDAGQPPEVTLDLPAGATAAPMRFPAPQRIPFGPLVNFGYEGEPVFIIPVTAPAAMRPGDVLTIEARGEWLVCEQVCIPEDGAFRIDIPVEATPRPANTALFTAAEAAEPRPGPFTARIGFAGTTGAIEVAGPDIAPGAVRDAFFFPIDRDLVANAAPQALSVTDGALRLSLVRGAAQALPAQLGGVVAITDSAGVRGAYLVSAAPGVVPEGGGLPLWQTAIFAALGGLILNLMPCVFPILAMKAVGIARLSGAAQGQVRAHAASYTAGVVLSFVALGGLLVALRAAGGMAGWGFQFTQPAFVAGMAWLMLAVGLNLSGVFAVRGPASAGQGLAAQGGHAGSFFTGALAVLVATPCTAPFMAAAIGAALAMGPIEAIAVFAALGLGMALPYALLGIAPGLARLLPRPGAWMDRLKQGLAFPMYAAAAWLVWVLAEQSGPSAVLAVLLGGVLIGFGAWAWGLSRGAVGRIAGAVALAGALALLPLVQGATPAAARSTEATGEAWSEARVAALRAEGRPVFVNLTAAWCITCKVNERMALATEGVQRAFAERGVATLVGDWTRGDPAITALLRAHQRDGVPLYLFYPPGGGAPRLLPQILTEGIVLQAISGPPGTG